jgi:hypothetical protein
MGRRLPKVGIRLGNSLTWKTTFHSHLSHVHRSWHFQEELIQKIIKGINRQFGYYNSEMVIHVYPKNDLEDHAAEVHIKYLVWSEDNRKSRKELFHVCSEVIVPILSYIFKEYKFKLDVRSIKRHMIYKNTELFGDYLANRLMSEPHRDKPIINREFKFASAEIQKFDY